MKPTSAVAQHAPEVVHLRTRAPVQGLHVLGEWYGCPRSEAIRRADRLRQIMLQLARECSLNVVAQTFEQFDPEGVIGTMILSDAHVAIHTWPDTGFVAVDFYACHLTPLARGRALAFLGKLRDCLHPVWVNAAEIKRGVPEAG